MADDEVDAALAKIAEHHVGGSFWGLQPSLPPAPYIVVQVKSQERLDEILRRLPEGCTILCRTDRPKGWSTSTRVQAFSGICDPWHLLSGATRVISDANDDLLVFAAMSQIDLECVGTGAFECLGGAEPRQNALRSLFRERAVEGRNYVDPFTGRVVSLFEIIDLLAFWRTMIDSNRDIDSALGFASWKRDTVAPLLWGGRAIPFARGAGSIPTNANVAIWRSRTSPAALAKLDRIGARLIEVEDGFIRSAGLGADCVPPLSIVVDRLGAHFDPDRESELENILRAGDFPTDLIDRARRLQDAIVTSGLSKYGASEARSTRRTTRRHILVTGQVEDDRSMLCGATLQTNHALLRTVREREPDAFISYKPHPDVEAGHRIGSINDASCLSLANEIVRDEPIAGLIAIADEVHVNTSLAGFEALLRGKPVTTYGVPFYAGWGLTCDLGAVPERRGVPRTIEELVAAVLLIYPRYLDPMTGLPCPAEVLIERLSTPSERPREKLLVKLRRLQGRGKRLFSQARAGKQ